ncbi:MAG: class I SAM-dependent methyltransferase [Immundisolibacteraceae bacterium]|nr:class I SAM-dependent methyltransferase [Immundisolibacteraceae bacterium]
MTFSGGLDQSAVGLEIEDADFSQPNLGLQQVLEQRLTRASPLRVLEAGCGSCTQIQLPEDRWVVGIDISEEQLNRNDKLDEKIVGDLQTHDLPKDTYDLVICWDVLEHLDDPGAAVDRMANALNEGGLLVLAAPHPWSFKGMVTRLTPHRMHVWFYRYFIGDKQAGVNGRGPFPTPMAKEMFPGQLVNRSEMLGLKQVLLYSYKGPVEAYVAERNVLYRGFSYGMKILSTLLSRGRWDTSHSDFFLVFSKV